MSLVKEVCKEEGYDFNTIDKLGNCIEIKHLGDSYFFSYTTTPFNREDVQHICVDKFLTYELINSKILMPKTKKYLRPDLDPNWHDRIEFSSKSEIVTNILENFSFPFILKMNAGSLGRNVFKCKNKEDVENAVAKIFKEDWALLAQELVYKEKEFRVIIVNNSVELAYQRGAKEFFHKKDEIFEELKKFLARLKELINLGWAGLDVILDKNDKLWLLEINTRPSFISAIHSGHAHEIKPLYKKAFRYYLSKVR